MSLLKHEAGEDGLHLLRIDDEKRHNVLRLETLAQLADALEALARDTSVRVLAITGAGRTFCTGADLGEIDRLEAHEYVDFSRRGQAVLDQLARFPQPTLAAINGLALGGGLELALACDLRWAHRRAFLGFPEIQHGICPAWGGVARLERVVARSFALDWLLRGTPISAAKAFAAGLVSRVFEGGEFWNDVRAAARPLLAGTAPLLRHYKALLGGQISAESCFAALCDARRPARPLRSASASPIGGQPERVRTP